MSLFLVLHQVKGESRRDFYRGSLLHVNIEDSKNTDDWNNLPESRIIFHTETNRNGFLDSWGNLAEFPYRVPV